MKPLSSPQEKQAPLISAADLHEAMLKVIAGPEKKSRVITPHARRLTSYHEAGHAIVIHALGSQDPVHQITIVPRGPAGGMTISLPQEDKIYQSKKELTEKIAVCLGGPVAGSWCWATAPPAPSAIYRRQRPSPALWSPNTAMSERLGTVVFDSGKRRSL